jgi:HD-GYP domain-containing protein (c-di-GMP phosphodiesterase class II)
MENLGSAFMKQCTSLRKIKKLRKIELNLVQKFALGIALVLIFLGWGLGNITTRYLEQQLLNIAQEKNLQTVYQNIKQGKKIIWLVTAGGFIFLYLALYGIFKNATRTAREQTLHLRRSAMQLEEAYVDTIRVLAAAIDAKDPYTSGHSSRIAKYARLVAQKLGFSSQRIRELEKACLFHDIGKIMIPEQILRKPGKLTPEEIVLVKQHPAVGANIIGMANSLSRYVPIVRCHQEKYDGSGYPEGLKNDEILLEAQIIALVDAYDAMVTERPYRKAMTSRRAKNEIKQQRGIQFHPQLVDAFLSIPDEEFNHRSGMERRLMELKHLSTEKRTGKERRSKSSGEKL